MEGVIVLERSKISRTALVGLLGISFAFFALASDLHAAAQAQNAEAVKDAIAKLKGPYSKFFLKFG